MLALFCLDLNSGEPGRNSSAFYNVELRQGIRPHSLHYTHLRRSCFHLHPGFRHQNH